MHWIVLDEIDDLVITIKYFMNAQLLQIKHVKCEMSF